MTKNFTTTVTKNVEARDVKIGDKVKVGEQECAVIDAYIDYNAGDNRHSIRLAGLPRALYNSAAYFTVVREEKSEVSVGTLVSLHGSLSGGEQLFVKVEDESHDDAMVWLSVSRTHHGFGWKFRNRDILGRLAKEKTAEVVEQG